MHKTFSVIVLSVLIAISPASVAAQSDLPDTLNAWKNDAQKRRQQNREKYDPDYILVSQEDWIALNTKALELIMGRALTKSEKELAIGELVLEHKNKKGRLYRGAQFYRSFFDAIEKSNNAFIKHAYAKRMYSRLYFAYAQSDRERSPFFQILQKNDPVLSDDPTSMTLITERDLVAKRRFEKSGSRKTFAANLSRNEVAKHVRAFQNQFKKAQGQRCTYAVRGASLLSPLAHRASERWGDLSAAERKKLVSFASGGDFPAALVTRLTGLDNKSAYYGSAGASNLDAAEQRMIDSAAIATAFIQNDPSTSLGITTPAISAAYAKQIAKCGG